MTKTEVQEILRLMRDAEAKAAAFYHLKGCLMYDMETVAPKDSEEGRGRTLAFLGNLEYDFMTDSELNSKLKLLKENENLLTYDQKRELDVTRKRIREVSSIPKEEYIDSIVLIDKATVNWFRAKEQKDYSIFAPYLKKIIEFNRKYASYLNPGMKPYDALINIYEEGMNMDFFDKFFDELKKGLVPLIEKISGANQVDDKFNYRFYPKEKQRELALDVMDMMLINPDRCILGEVEHPFTDAYNNRDVRITTHYHENNMMDSLYSVMHEGGHALYELNMDDRFNYTAFMGGASYGIHESQSRFYENIIGHSREFMGPLCDCVRKHFPEQLEDVDKEKFYRGLNKVQPGPVRLEADELTYCLHIMVRYEIEKQLIEGSLDVEDAPRVWAELYKEYLGVEPCDDSEGILQDSHWAGGSFGYFPTYALGSAYGAQMMHCMEKEMPDIWEDISKGDLKRVNAWLKDNIQRYSSFYKPKELFERACGAFDAGYFVKYLTKKFTEVYGL